MKRSTKKKATTAVARKNGEWIGVFNDLALKTCLLAQAWDGYYFNAALRRRGRIDEVTAKRTLAAARILRAMVAALVTDDDIELERRAKESVRYVGARSRTLIEKTGTAMVSLGKYGSQFQFSVHDTVPEKGQLGTRAHAAARLRSTLARHIAQKTTDAGELAHVFLLSLDGPWGLREFFVEHRIDLDSEDQRAARGELIEKAYASYMERSNKLDAERLVILAARALGVKKAAAESLFDAERARTERAKRK